MNVNIIIFLSRILIKLLLFKKFVAIRSEIKCKYYIDSFSIYVFVFWNWDDNFFLRIGTNLYDFF